MNTNISGATRISSVDIELPLFAQAGATDQLQHRGDDGSRACPFAETDLAPLEDRVAYAVSNREPSMGDVAAHPARLRVGKSERLDAGNRYLSVSRAIRTGSVGLGELAACGQ